MATWVITDESCNINFQQNGVSHRTLPKELMVLEIVPAGAPLNDTTVDNVFVRYEGKYVIELPYNDTTIGITAYASAELLRAALVALGNNNPCVSAGGAGDIKSDGSVDFVAAETWTDGIGDTIVISPLSVVAFDGVNTSTHQAGASIYDNSAGSVTTISMGSGTFVLPSGQTAISGEMTTATDGVDALTITPNSITGTGNITADTQGTAYIGDPNGNTTGVTLEIQVGGSQMQYYDNNGTYLFIDQINGAYRFGDTNGVGNGTKIEIDDTIGALNLTATTTTVVGDFVTPQISDTVAGGVTIDSIAEVMPINLTAGTFIRLVAAEDSSITFTTSGLGDININTAGDINLNGAPCTTTTVTTAGLVGKTMTFTDGFLTDFS